MTIYGLGNSANSYILKAFKGKEAKERPRAKDADASDKSETAAQILYNEYKREPENNEDYKKFLFFDDRASINDKFALHTSKPRDSSAQLTKRLVASTGQFQVRQVMSEANKNLVGLRMAAAGAEGKDAARIQSYIRKLETLLTRARRKIRDLDSEDALKITQARAQKKKQQKRVEEIKEELRKKLVERKARENSYLIGKLQDKMLGLTNLNNKQDPTSEALIAAKAEALAAAETATGGAGSDAGGDGAADVSTGSQPTADSVAAATSAEGGNGNESVG